MGSFSFLGQRSVRAFRNGKRGIFSVVLVQELRL